MPSSARQLAGTVAPGLETGPTSLFCGALQHIISTLVTCLTAHPVISIVSNYALQLIFSSFHASLTAFPVAGTFASYSLQFLFLGLVASLPPYSLASWTKLHIIV